MDYWQYLALPLPVLTLWRVAAREESLAFRAARDSSQPTQDLLTQAIEEEAADQAAMRV